MLKTILFPSCAILTIAVAGCTTMQNPSTERNLNGLQAKNWVLSEIDGVKLTTDSSKSILPSIQFDNEQVSGSDGCNRYMGGYAVQGTEIKFSNLASTKKACLDATDLPQKYSQALAQVTHFDSSKKELKLLDANNQVILKFNHVSSE
jgi:heat shock protein HslJ